MRRSSLWLALYGLVVAMPDVTFTAKGLAKFATREGGWASLMNANMDIIDSLLDGGGGGVTDHGALTGLADDDHPQYATDTDLASHVAGVDPHTGYQKESEKGATNGYASLDATGKIPDSQIAAAIARDTELHAAVHALTGSNHTGLPGDPTKFYNGVGGFTVPAGGGGGTTPDMPMLSRDFGAGLGGADDTTKFFQFLDACKAVGGSRGGMGGVEALVYNFPNGLVIPAATYQGIHVYGQGHVTGNGTTIGPQFYVGNATNASGLPVLFIEHTGASGMNLAMLFSNIVFRGNAVTAGCVRWNNCFAHFYNCAAVNSTAGYGFWGEPPASVATGSDVSWSDLTFCKSFQNLNDYILGDADTGEAAGIHLNDCIALKSGTQKYVGICVQIHSGNTGVFGGKYENANEGIVVTYKNGGASIIAPRLESNWTRQIRLDRPSGGSGKTANTVIFPGGMGAPDGGGAPVRIGAFQDRDQLIGVPTADPSIDAGAQHIAWQRASDGKGCHTHLGTTTVEQYA